MCELKKTSKKTFCQNASKSNSDSINCFCLLIFLLQTSHPLLTNTTTINDECVNDKHVKDKHVKDEHVNDEHFSDKHVNDHPYLLRDLIEQNYRATINRTVLPPNEGFHRDLLTTVSIESASPQSASNCTLLLLETLPSGLYVDAFQMRNLVQFGGPTLYTEKPIDTELPEFESKPQKLYVYQPLYLDASRGRLTSSLFLSVHLRYHKPSSSQSHQKVVFPHPQTFVSCEAEDEEQREKLERLSMDLKGKNLKVDPRVEKNFQLLPCQTSAGSGGHPDCPWVPLVASASTPPPEFLVPLGDSDHFTFVVFVTLVACCLGMAQVGGIMRMSTATPPQQQQKHEQYSQQQQLQQQQQQQQQQRTEAEEKAHRD